MQCLNQIFQHSASTSKSTVNSCLLLNKKNNDLLNDESKNLLIKKDKSFELQTILKTPSQILNNSPINQKCNDKLLKSSLKDRKNYRRYKSLNLHLNDQKKEALKMTSSINNFNNKFKTKKSFIHLSNLKEKNFLTKSKRQLNSGYNLLFQRFFKSTTLLVTPKKQPNNQCDSPNLMLETEQKKQIEVTDNLKNNKLKKLSNLTKNSITSTPNNVRFRENFFTPNKTPRASKFSILSNQKICASAVNFFSQQRNSFKADLKKFNRKRPISSVHQNSNLLQTTPKSHFFTSFNTNQTQSIKKEVFFF